MQIQPNFDIACNPQTQLRFNGADDCFNIAQNDFRNIEIFSDNTILINYKYYASGIIFNKKSDLIDRVKLLFLD